MDRRGFLRGILGAATLPLIPVLGPISDAKRTVISLYSSTGVYWAVEEWYVPNGIIKIKAKLRIIPFGTYDCTMAS